MAKAAPSSGSRWHLKAEAVSSRIVREHQRALLACTFHTFVLPPKDRSPRSFGKSGYISRRFEYVAEAELASALDRFAGLIGKQPAEFAELGKQKIHRFKLEEFKRDLAHLKPAKGEDPIAAELRKFFAGQIIFTIEALGCRISLRSASSLNHCGSFSVEVMTLVLRDAMPLAIYPVPSDYARRKKLWVNSSLWLAIDERPYVPLVGKGAGRRKRRTCLVHRTHAGRLSRRHRRNTEGFAPAFYRTRTRHAPQFAPRMAPGTQSAGGSEVVLGAINTLIGKLR